MRGPGSVCVCKGIPTNGGKAGQRPQGRRKQAVSEVKKPSLTAGNKGPGHLETSPDTGIAKHGSEATEQGIKGKEVSKTSYKST